MENLKIGDKVLVSRFGKVGIINEVETDKNGKMYIVQYNVDECEALRSWELEKM